MTDKILCIYHAPCIDGFAAAWVVHQALGDAVEFVPASYGDAPPDVAGRDVLIVDFSYKEPVLRQMIASGVRRLTILDHHKTAAEDLAFLPQIEGNWADLNYGPKTGQGAIFDMERSGAGLAWDFFFPLNKRPPMIDHIEDRDLWRFRYDDTRDIVACIASYPYNFATWTELSQSNIGDLAVEGRAIHRNKMKDINELIQVAERMMKIGGQWVPVVNVPYMMASEAGNLLAISHKFAATYIDTPRGRQFSLRSTKNGLDVSEIAKLYGGGGHRNAAGFTMPLGWEGDGT